MPEGSLKCLDTLLLLHDFVTISTVKSAAQCKRPAQPRKTNRVRTFSTAEMRWTGLPCGAVSTELECSWCNVSHLHNHGGFTEIWVQEQAICPTIIYSTSWYWQSVVTGSKLMITWVTGRKVLQEKLLGHVRELAESQPEYIALMSHARNELLAWHATKVSLPCNWHAEQFSAWMYQQQASITTTTTTMLINGWVVWGNTHPTAKEGRKVN